MNGPAFDLLRRNLNATLDHKRLTVHALAGRDQKVQRTFHRVFKGEVCPNLETLERICDALDVAMWEVLCPWYRPGWKARDNKPLDRDRLSQSILTCFNMFSTQSITPTAENVLRFTLMLYDESDKTTTKGLETPPRLVIQPSASTANEAQDDGRTVEPYIERALVGKSKDGTAVSDKPKATRTHRAVRKSV